MRRLCSHLLVLLAAAIPCSARVLSYAPYTDRLARAGVHERTTRHFVVIETGDRVFGKDQLVLYDSTGVEEPRVVYPNTGPSSGTTPIFFAALYQKSPDAPPMLLAGTAQGEVFSTDGGATWKTLASRFSILASSFFDFGGPFVQGLGAQILPGNDEYPFVFATWGNIRALHVSGQLKVLRSANWQMRLLGRNAAGDQFLVQTNPSTVETVDLAGQSRVVTTDTNNVPGYGWITNDGAVYLADRTQRRLRRHRDGVIESSFDSTNFFAIPTHDFNGAWILQRNAQATTLSRLDGSGLATMWSDEAAPRVEALIAGRSGETLLLQVHRPRDGEGTPARPIVDPALAVWHVGQPKPAAYDELYLREELSRGFVHVDVDALESGAPFVLNSGFFESAGEAPPISSAPPGGGDIIQEWGIVRSSLRQRLVLPGVARLRGANDSYWLTDITIYNAFDTPQDVEVRYAPLGTDMTAVAAFHAATITLAAGETRVVRDVLKTLLHLESGGGALTFLPSRAVAVTSRTYTRREDGGTFGYGMLGIDAFNAASSRFPVTFAAAFPGETFRTNLLLTDVSGHGSNARLTFLGSVGILGMRDVTMAAPPGGVAQRNEIRLPFALPPDFAGGLRVEPARGFVIPTVVAIDNLTNDPMYVAPDPPEGSRRTIPVIGHLDGVNGSRYRSDLYLLNPGNGMQEVTMVATNWATRQQRWASVRLFANEVRVIPDALFTLFGMTGLAWMQFETPGSDGIRITSRAYTVTENGGTFGCLVPPSNSFQIAPAGDSLEILGIYGGRDFRVNLGLVDLSPSTSPAARVRITIFDESSKTLDTFVQSIPAGGGLQLNDIFAARNLATPQAARIVVAVESGLITTYATLTDNRTNDPTYLAAQLGAQP